MTNKADPELAVIEAYDDEIPTVPALDKGVAT